MVAKDFDVILVGYGVDLVPRVGFLMLLLLILVFFKPDGSFKQFSVQYKYRFNFVSEVGISFGRRLRQ